MKQTNMLPELIENDQVHQERPTSFDQKSLLELLSVMKQKFYLSSEW
jgi:hypothetical protein